MMGKILRKSDQLLQNLPHEIAWLVSLSKAEQNATSDSMCLAKKDSWSLKRKHHSADDTELANIHQRFADSIS